MKKGTPIMVSRLKDAIRQWRYNREFKRFIRHQLKETNEKLDAELADIHAIVGILEMDFIFSPGDEEGEDEDERAPIVVTPSPPLIFGIGMSTCNVFAPMFTWFNGGILRGS